MRSLHARGQRITLTLTLTPLMVACNTVIGVVDVSLAPPDGSLADCDVAPDFGLVMADPTTSRLFRRGGQIGSNMLIEINDDARPDILNLSLYDNNGGHGALEVPGTYSITSADAKWETCGICLLIEANVDSATTTVSQVFMALDQGSMVLTRADSAGLAGQLQDLKFRRVDNSDGVTQEINSNCAVTIQEVRFDLAYSL